MIKWIVVIHLAFATPGLNRHITIPWTFNPNDGYTFKDECERDARAYNAAYGGLADDGVFEHAFCKPVKIP